MQISLENRIYNLVARAPFHHLGAREVREKSPGI